MEDFGYKKYTPPKKSLGIFKKLALLIGISASVGIFIYITINAYYFIYQDSSSNIEIIKSPEGPIKIKEEVKFNEEENNNKHIIYDDIFGNKKENLKRETKIRSSSEPVLPPQIEKNKFSDNEINSNYNSSLKNSANDQSIIVYDNNNQKNIQKSILTNQSNEKITQEKIISPNKSQKINNNSTEEYSSSKESIKKNQEKKMIRVQLAAMSKKQTAEEIWKGVNNAHHSLFKGLKPIIEEVDLGRRGIFYRLQIGYFFNQIEAESFCNKYIIQTQRNRADCIVVE